MALLDYKCPNCGGAIQFDPGTQEMVCPFCDSVMNVTALQELDEALAQEQAAESIDWGYEGGHWQDGEQEGMVVYSCNSCSGEIIGDETLGATHCPFCDNPVVMTSKFSGSLRPDIVIPFKLGKDRAVQALEQHYLRKRLLPKVFKDKNHIDEVKGIYVPFWLFDANAEAKIEYSATKVRHWSDKDYSYTETSNYRVLREGSIGFVHVPVDGSTAMDDALMESIEPFRMEDGTPFQTAYLAGYFANKYDVDAEQSIDRANQRIKRSTETSFAQTVKGFNSVNARNTNIHLNSGGVTYALLPVWLLSTSWQGKNFIFAMNGQTGKFAGDLPLDKGACRRWFWGITLGIGVAISALIALTWTIQGVLV